MDTLTQDFALIGPGKVGIAFAYLLRQHGYRLRMVVGRSETSLERARGYLQAGTEGRPEFTTDLASLPPDLDFLVIGVKDGQIAEMIRNLRHRGLLRPHQVALHFSGVLPADAGHTAKRGEGGRLSIHPLQACPDVEAGILRLPAAVWSIEGDAPGLTLGERLLHSISARWFRITREQKPLYHAAAAFASNYLVTVTKIAVDVLTRAGIPPELAQEALWPLIQGTVENLREKKPEDALTGAIARGDTDTVTAHLQAIRAAGEPEWQELYRVLGEATTGFAPVDQDTRIRLIRVLAGDIPADAKPE